MSGVQQVSGAEFGLLQGGFAAQARTAEELHSTFSLFSITLGKRNQTFSSPSMLKATDSTLEKVTLASVAIKQDHKKLLS